MSDNRKYYYLKLKENFYNSETMVILESMQDGLLYSNLLLKMYLMSLKSGGILMLNDHLPHTPQTIATFARHQVGTVERALKVFLEFGLVEILTDGAYYMTDIQLLIGQSSTEGERKKKERMRLKRQKLLPSGGADICPPYSRGDICPPEIRDIHEIAHAKLHDIDLNAPLEDLENRPDRRTREVQAESIAYTVCQHYGLDTSDYSFGYVAGWSAGRELTELKSSLETIRSTAAEIINSIDEHMPPLCCLC